jgi:hypothetical protein
MLAATAYPTRSLFFFVGTGLLLHQLLRLDQRVGRFFLYSPFASAIGAGLCSSGILRGLTPVQMLFYQRTTGAMRFRCLAARPPGTHRLGLAVDSSVVALGCQGIARGLFTEQQLVECIDDLVKRARLQYARQITKFVWQLVEGRV